MTAVYPGGQLPFDYGHTPSHHEDDFIEGEGNALALAHVRAFPGWAHPLTLIEGHVQIDEGQRQRIVTAIQGIREEHRETRDTTREAAATVATEIKQAVAEVPEKVVEKIQEAGTGESGIHNRPRQ